MSERVQAIGMALDAMERRRTGAPAPMAVCRKCEAPLIPTVAFSGFEFYCLECGAHYGFVQPKAAESTAELGARYEQLLAEWNEHVGQKLVGRFWLVECERCQVHREYHVDHATGEERQAHDEAIAWLDQRAHSSPGEQLT